MDYYEKIRENIKILNVSFYEEFLGIKIIIKIEDNNKTYFKNKTLKKESLGIETAEEVDKEIKRAIDRYICDKYPIYRYINSKAIKEWKEKNGM